MRTAEAGIPEHPLITIACDCLACQRRTGAVEQSKHHWIGLPGDERHFPQSTSERAGRHLAVLQSGLEGDFHPPLVLDLAIV